MADKGVITDTTLNAKFFLICLTYCEYILFHVTCWQKLRTVAFSRLLIFANQGYLLKLLSFVSDSDLLLKLGAPFRVLIRDTFKRNGGLWDKRGGHRSRFQLIFVQKQSSVSLLVKPLISFHCALTSLASSPQKPF